jgi:hypothetical protein
MLRSGQEMFVSFAGGSKVRVLHHAKVESRVDDLLTVRYSDPDGLPGERPEQVTVFFDGPKEFMQQPGQVVALETPEEPGQEGLLTAVRVLGEPVSAETRQCYRVGTVLADYKAKLGRLGTCKLVDVSAVGVGFLCEQKLSLGEQTTIELSLGGRTSRGLGFIQSIKEVAGGYRYGLLCLEDHGQGGLAKGLQQLTMDAQRTQLRRLAGAA